MILRSSCRLILCRNREASPSAGDDSPFRRFEAAILDALRSSASPCSASPSSASHCGAVPVAAIMPHLYDLKDDGPALEYVRGLREPLVVLSWLPARACYWRLRAAGVAGAMVTVEEDKMTPTSSDNSPPASTRPDLESGATGVSPVHCGARAGCPWHPENEKRPDTGSLSVVEPDISSRAVWCLDLHDYARPEDCAAAVRRILAEIGRAGSKGGTEGGAKGESGTDVQEIGEPTSTRWYPVIDRDRCVNCLECLNFCLFGVYGLDEAETIRVEQPDACRPGCPACARVCPSGAILFPEHGDPAISGRSVKEAERAAGGATMLLPMFDPLARAHAERDAAGSAEPGASKSSHSLGEAIPPAKNARLDELVDDVDRFDLS